MLIYLASPYTFKHDDPEEVKRMQHLRYKTIQSVTAALMNKGFVVFSPIVYGHNLAVDHELPTNWDYWRHTLEEMVPRYDQLWVAKMEGWERSTGVQAEIFIATTNRIPVIYRDMNDPLFK